MDEIDNVSEKHRAVFERVFRETQELMVQRMMDADLPNAYVEVVAARMIAIRAAAADQSLENVAMRVVAMACAWDSANAEALSQVRERSRALRARKDESKH